MFSYVISRSSKVNQVHLGLSFFCIPIGYHVVKNDENTNICTKFLVFDLRVLVLACLTNSSLKYRGAHPSMHLKVKSRILKSILFLMGSK